MWAEVARRHTGSAGEACAHDSCGDGAAVGMSAAAGATSSSRLRDGIILVASAGRDLSR